MSRISKEESCTQPEVPPLAATPTAAGNAKYLRRANRVALRVEIAKELDRALERKAVDLDLSKRDCVEMAIRAWLDDGEQAA